MFSQEEEDNENVPVNEGESSFSNLTNDFRTSNLSSNDINNNAAINPYTAKSSNNNISNYQSNFAATIDDKQFDRLSFQSVVQFRQPGARRSEVLSDTPGHFPRAKEIEEEANISLRDNIVTSFAVKRDDSTPTDGGSCSRETINAMIFDNPSELIQQQQRSSIIESINEGKEEASNVFLGSQRSSNHVFEECKSLMQVSIEIQSPVTPGEQQQQKNIEEMPISVFNDSALRHTQTSVHISNLKDLLKLFKIDISENNSFELNGQNYFVDLDHQKNFDMPLHTMSAFFAPQDISAQAQRQQSLLMGSNAHRATFGNLIEQFNLGNNMHTQSKLPQFNNNYYQNSSSLEGTTLNLQGSALGVEARTKLSGLPNLDKLLLSNEPSPTSVANKFQNANYFPNFGGGPSFSRDCSEKDTLISVLKHDKEIQVELLTDTNNIAIDRTQSNISGITVIQGIQTKNASSFDTRGPGIYNFNNSDERQQSNNNILDSDYYAEMQRKLALQIEEEELGLPDPSQMGKGKKKGKKITKTKSSMNEKEKEVVQNTSEQASDNFSNNLTKSVSNSGNFIASGSATTRISKIADVNKEKHHNISNNNHGCVSQKIVDFDLNQMSSVGGGGPSYQTGPSLRRVMSTREQSMKHENSSHMQLMFSQMQSHNAKLQEEIDKIKKEVSDKYIGGVSKNLDQAKLHLVFLFASPLVVKKPSTHHFEQFKDQYRSQALLEFKKEFKEIKHSLKETKQHIKVKSLQATIENLSMILPQNPLALHFTGHGFETRYQGKVSNSLLLEDEDGQGEEVSEQQLTKIIQTANTDLEFVFVASCYSEFAGKAFLKAGARHVICVKSGNQIADVAVLLFSKSFYHLVFSQNMTICASFDMAKSQVQIRYGPAEAAKFSILTKKECFGQSTATTSSQDTISKPKPKKKKKRFAGMPDISDDEEYNVKLEPTHICKVFGPFKKGEIESLDVDAKFSEVPSSVENFIGRQIEVFEVVHNVINHRFVNIIGLPGIGKTALAKNAANYMADRKTFKQGIVFFSLKGYKSSSVFLKKLVTNIVVHNFDLEPDEQTHINEGNIEKLFRMIVEYFKTMEDQLLVVFDNAEELLYHDRKGFRDLITELLNHCKCLKFLLTSRVTVGVLQDIQEKIVVLHELTPTQSVDLFFSRARDVSEEEKKELLNFKPENFMLVGDSNHTNQNEEITNISKHHLFKILAGNPHAIILAAPLLLTQKRRLKDLYELLNSEKLVEVLKVDGVTDSTVASLCLSLEASIIVLEKEDQFSLHFFYLIGLLPGGIFKDELSIIWKMGKQDPGYEYHVEKLMTLSLLQVKEQAGDKKVSKLMLPPFINNYAEQTIDPALKTKFQQMLCEYYVKILRDLYRTDYRQWANAKNNQEDSISNDSKDVTPRRQQQEKQFIAELRMKLIRHETNIWACVYRMAKSDKPIQIEHLELENILQVSQKGKRVRRMSEMTPRDKTNTLFQIKQNHRKTSNFDQMSTDFSSLDENIKSVDNMLVNIGHSQSEKNKRELQKLNSSLPIKHYFVPSSQIINEDENDNKSDISDNTGKRSPIDLGKPDFYHTNSKDHHEDSDMSSHSSHDNDDHDLHTTNPLQTLFRKSSEHQKVGSSRSSISSSGTTPQVFGTEESQSNSGDLSKKKTLTERLTTSFSKVIQEQIQSILRHSIVNFCRPSLRASMAHLPHHENENQDGGLVERPGQVESDDEIYLPQKCFSQQQVLLSGMMPAASSPDSIRIAQLSESEKLLIYYGMNLYLLKDYESAEKLINMYGLEIQGSLLFKANIQRILGLIHLRKVEIKEAMIAFKKAEDFYEKCHCFYGSALAKFSIGFMYRSNFSGLLNTEEPQEQKSQQDMNSAAQKTLQQALRLFQQLNHIVGQARCHEHLSFIQKKFGHETQSRDHQKDSCELNSQFGKYLAKYKKSCPHIQRSYGQDISLMCEIVVDNETRNLFPDLGSSFITTPSNSLRNQLAAKRELSSKIVSPFNDIEDKQPALSHQVSAPPLHINSQNSVFTITPQNAAHNISPFSQEVSQSQEFLHQPATFGQKIDNSNTMSTIDDPFFGSEDFQREEEKYNSPLGRASQLFIPQSPNPTMMSPLKVPPLNLSAANLSAQHNNNQQANIFSLDIVREEEDSVKDAGEGVILRPQE